MRDHAFIDRDLSGRNFPFRGGRLNQHGASRGASLSQLQLVLWTFVVAASAVYVMVLSGELIEYAPTEKIFIKPAKKQTEDYITGRFG